MKKQTKNIKTDCYFTVKDLSNSELVSTVASTALALNHATALLRAMKVTPIDFTEALPEIIHIGKTLDMIMEQAREELSSRCPIVDCNKKKLEDVFKH